MVHNLSSAVAASENWAMGILRRSLNMTRGAAWKYIAGKCF